MSVVSVRSHISILMTLTGWQSTVEFPVLFWEV